MFFFMFFVFVIVDMLFMIFFVLSGFFIGVDIGKVDMKGVVFEVLVVVVFLSYWVGVCVFVFWDVGVVFIDVVEVFFRGEVMVLVFLICKVFVVDVIFELGRGWVGFLRRSLVVGVVVVVLVFYELFDIWGLVVLIL